MQTRFILPIVATLALGATAANAADQAPRGPGHHWRMDRKDMAQHFKNRCANRYAHAVGTMAYLETRLNLTSAQKGAFERWKDVVLNSAKKGADACAAMKMPDHRPTLVEKAKWQEKRLEMRLDGLKAQMPALENLTAKLDDNQDRILDRAIRKMMRHGRGHGRQGWGHHRGRGMGPGMGRGMGPGMGGGRMGPPPPPDQDN